MNKCEFCERVDTKYCTLCDKWFCADCNKRYDKRIIAMVKEKFWKKGIKWFTDDEVDQMKKDGKWK